MDLDSRAREENAGLWDEMLSKVIEKGTCFQWGSSQKDPSSHCRIWWTPYHGQETKIKVVWLCINVFWFSKDNSTGHSEWKKKKRWQKKRWEVDINEWTGMDFASSTRAAEDRTRWRGCCEAICGAPTTMQVYGIRLENINKRKRSSRKHILKVITKDKKYRSTYPI